MEFYEQLASTLQSLITIIAITIGGWWAYRKYVRHRTLNPRLEFLFDFKRPTLSNKSSVAILSIKVKNVGNSKVDLRKDKDQQRCFLKCGLIPVPSNSTDIIGVLDLQPESKELKTIDHIFTAHKWIEPNESIWDARILSLPNDENIALQVELIVYGYGTRTKWSTKVIFSLTGDATIHSTNEQEDYDEEERRRDKIDLILYWTEMKLASITNKEEKAEIQKLIEYIREHIWELARLDIITDLISDIQRHSELEQLKSKLEKLEDVLRE